MRKVFIQVNADFSPDGGLTPLYFVWEDGRKYEIDRIYGHKRAASLKAGGQGLRYRCQVMGKEVYIFLEEGRWFMEGK